MTRRYARMRKKDGTRSGLALYDISNEIVALANAEMEMTIETPVTQKQAYDLLIPEEARRALRAAAPYLLTTWSADSVSQFIGCGVDIEFKRDAIGEVICRSLPKNNTLSVAAELLEQSEYHHLVPLLKIRDQVLALHRKWAVVRFTLAWMDTNFSAKTIRSLMPAVKLLKGAEGVPDDLDPKTPVPVLGHMLPLIRETGVVLSGAQFLPKTAGKFSRAEGDLLRFSCRDKTPFKHGNAMIVSGDNTYTL